MKKNLLNIIRAIAMLALGFSTAAAQAQKKITHFQKQEKVFATVSKVEKETLLLQSRKATPAYSFENSVLKITHPAIQPVMLLQMQRINIENERDHSMGYPLNDGIKKPFINHSFMVESTLRQIISHSNFVLY